MENAAPPPPAALWISLIGIGLLGSLMVFAMVRYSGALLSTSPQPHQRFPWGTAYVLAWAGIIAGFLWMFHIGRAMTRHNLTMLAIIAGFWLGLHALMIALARAIRNANVDARPAVAAEREDQPPPMPPEDEAEPAHDPEPPPPVPSGKAPGQRVRDAARMIVMLALVLLVIGVGEAIPAMQRLKALLDAHRYPLLPTAIAAAILGTLMLAGGGAAMAIRGGRRMTRDEIDHASADTRMWRGPGHVVRKAGYRNLGDAEGVTASDEVSLAELKLAWRTRAWLTSPRWRIIFVMGFGAAVMAGGIWATLFVVAPAGVKFLVTLVFGYALVRTTWALFRC